MAVGAPRFATPGARDGHGPDGRLESAAWEEQAKEDFSNGIHRVVLGSNSGMAWSAIPCPRPPDQSPTLKIGEMTR